MEDEADSWEREALQLEDEEKKDGCVCFLSFELNSKLRLLRERGEIPKGMLRIIGRFFLSLSLSQQSDGDSLLFSLSYSFFFRQLN